MIYLLTSCNTEKRLAQNIYVHDSNRNYKKIVATVITLLYVADLSSGICGRFFAW